MSVCPWASSSFSHFLLPICLPYMPIIIRAVERLSPASVFLIPTMPILCHSSHASLPSIIRMGGWEEGEESSIAWLHNGIMYIPVWQGHTGGQKAVAAAHQPPYMVHFPCFTVTIVYNIFLYVIISVTYCLCPLYPSMPFLHRIHSLIPFKVILWEEGGKVMGEVLTPAQCSED